MENTTVRTLTNNSKMEYHLYIPYVIQPQPPMTQELIAYHRLEGACICFYKSKMETPTQKTDNNQSKE